MRSWKWSLGWVLALVWLFALFAASQAASILVRHTTLADFSAGDSDAGFMMTQYENGELAVSPRALGLNPWIELVSMPLPQTLYDHTAIAAHNYLFIIGGRGVNGVEQAVSRATILPDGTLGPWQAMPPLPQPLYRHTVVKAGGSLLVIGGERTESIEITGTVYRTTLAANGDMSNWAELTPLPEVRSETGAAVVNGFLFVIAGRGSNGVRQPTVYRAALKADGSLGSWTTTTPLPVALSYHAVASIGNCLFVVGGGQSEIDVQSEIYSTVVEADGTITAWQELADARLPQPLLSHTATAASGSLFVVGGFGISPPADQDKVYQAAIKADCTLEPWQELAGATLPRAVENHAVAATDRYLFITGGRIGGGVNRYDTVYRAAIIPDQNLVGWQALNQTPLPQPLSGHAAALGKDYLFVTGGLGETGVQSTVYRAAALTAGQTGAWTAVAALPQALRDHVTLAVGNQLLTIGGHNGSTDQNTVYEAMVQTDGSLSAWQSHPCALPLPLSSHAAVLAGDFIFLNGGRQGFSERAEVYRLRRDDNGSQGCWQPVAALPQPLAEHAMAATTDYLFVSGGVTGGGGNATNTIYSAAVAADGSLSGWTELSATPLPTFLRSHVMVAANGYLHVAGGSGPIGQFTKYQVYRAKIKAGGTLEAWQELTTTPLPQALENHVAVATDLHLLIFGGYRNGQPQSAAYVTSLYQGVRQAAFAHQFDLGSVQDIGILNWQARGDPDAVLSIRFRLAGDDATYSPWSEAFTEPSIPIYDRGRYLQYQLLLENPNGGVKAIDEVSLTYGDVGDYVKVISDNGASVPGAEVYLNGQLVGMTAVRGILAPEALPRKLQPGDQLAVLSQVAQAGTIREAHVTPDSGGVNWAYRTHLTNLEVIPPTGQILPYTVTQSGGQVISLQHDNLLVLFNLLVSIEWDADVDYTQQISAALHSASDYLYDLTDGQMAFGRVAIYDNAEYWADADLQISTKNIVRPHAYIGGITSNDKSHVIRVGRFWDGNSGNQGDWDQQDGFRTLTHEFGHYGLYLYDEYFAYVFGPNGDLVGEAPAYCTGPENRNPATDATNASAMDYQYTSSELSTRGVPNLWSLLCEQTAQWQLNGESTWETLARRYADFLNPPRWQFTTPLQRNSPVAGPTNLPSILPDWPLVEVYQDGPSAPRRRLTVYGPQGPYWAAQAALYTNQNGRPVAIDQGFTDQLGQIDIYGAQPGDTLRAASFDGALSGSVSVTDVLNYTITMVTPASLQTLAVPGLNPHLTLRPSSDGETLYLRLSGLGPGGTLVAVATQSGGTASQTTALSYSSAEQAYAGTVTFSAPQAQRGTGTVQVIGAGVGSQGISLNSTYALQAAPKTGVTDLYSADGNLHVHLITDTLPVDAYAVLTPLNAAPIAPAEGWQLAGNAYDIRLSGALEGADRPFILQLRYDPEFLRGNFIGPATLQIYRWEPDPDPTDPTNQTHWLALNSSWLEEDNSVSIVTDRFGVYALMGFSVAQSTYLPIITKSN